MNKFWLEIPEHFPFVKLDVHVVMPNHVHGIVGFDDHIIRNNAEYQRIKNYIISNPKKWNNDALNA